MAPKFLFSVTRPGAKDLEHQQLPDGVAVMPSFPLGQCNRFIGCGEDEYSDFAESRSIPDDFDYDEFVAKVVRTYPGLPVKYIEDLVVATAASVTPLKEGKVWRVFVTPESARLHSVEEDEEIVELWEHLNTNKYL